MTTETTTPTPEPPAPRRLVRASEERVIAGVCSGIGRYFGIDPVVVRLITVVLVFFGGAGLIAYGAAWLLVPSDKAADGGSTGRALAKRTAVVLGVIVLTGIAAFGGGWGAPAAAPTTVAIIVIAAGAGLVVGGFTVGLRWLIPPALALALAAGVVAAADVDARGGVGERIYRPLASGELRQSYHLGVGHLVVDLRETELAAGDNVVKLRLGMGGAEVLVPRGACVSTNAHLGIGGTQVFDRDSGGVDVDFQDQKRASALTPRVVVDADIGIGGLRVQPGEHGRYVGNEACADG
jgi:phage shock protein PspC (stress-responsive transcriptional regulator)